MAGTLAETERNQRRASHPRASAWVGANAGTGKTHVLTQRVIRLLLEGVAPERILCLTFTKAAAAQMQNRLFSQLGDWTTRDDDGLIDDIRTVTGEVVEREDLPLARRLFAQALETPGGLKIQTIHAFCQTLLGRFPIEANVPPHFEVLDERLAAEMTGEAVAGVLDDARGEPGGGLAGALDHVLAQVTEEGFAAVLGEVVANRGRLMRLLQDSGGLGGLLRRLAAGLGLAESATEESVTAELCAEFGRRRDALATAHTVLCSGSKRDTDAAERLAVFLGEGDALKRLDALRLVLLTTADAPRKDVMTKALKRDHPETAAFLENLQQDMLQAVERLRAARVFQSTSALMCIAERFLTRFADAKRRQGGLDYDDLILRTRDLLTSSSSAAWVLYKLDGGLDHILIDEAQDTSPDQWEVIAALAEEFFAGEGAQWDRDPRVVRTLFAVGDEKQSIFSFQGADPEKFEEMRTLFGERARAAALTWEEVDLTLSFRSVAAILETVDRLFIADDVVQGITQSGRPISHTTKRLGQAGLVELWPLVEPPDVEAPNPWDAPVDQQRPDSPPHVLARRIVGAIQEWIDHKEPLPSRGRPIRPGDIMILVRRRDVLAREIIRQLKKIKIAVAGADRMKLMDQIAVMDLMAAADFALLPSDDYTLAVVLKSPLIELTEDALFQLAQGRTGTLWQALEAAACADENSRFKKAHAFLSSLRARADVIPPFEFFQEILDHRFGDGETARQRLIRRLGVDADDPISEFMSMTLAYERTSVPTLQGFLEWVAAGDSELKREYDQGRDEVRVMTVHGAKGLQAPIVILPDTCSVPTPRHDPALIGIGDDLVVWPVRKANDVAAITQARQRADENRFAEYYRLFYVAATRAEDRLYVAGHGARDRLDPRAWYALAEAAIVPEAETVALASGETGWRIAQPQSAVSDRDAQPEPSRLTRAPLPVWAHVKAETEAPPVASRAPSAPRTDDPADFGEPAPFSPLAKDDDDRFRRGLIVHKLLEILPQLPRAQRRKAALRRIESAMPAWTGDACDALADEVLGILDDARFASVFGPDSLAEVGLAGAPARLGGIAFGGQVDRLIVEPERVLIVDYKTNRPVPVNVDGVPRLYLQQMAVYRALLQDVYPDRPVHCALLWTAAPSLMALPEQVLDEAKESAIADHP